MRKNTVQFANWERGASEAIEAMETAVARAKKDLQMCLDDPGISPRGCLRTVTRIQESLAAGMHSAQKGLNLAIAATPDMGPVDE